MSIAFVSLSLGLGFAIVSFASSVTVYVYGVRVYSCLTGLNQLSAEEVAVPDAVVFVATGFMNLSPGKLNLT